MSLNKKLSALADPNRQKIINLLKKREMSVSELLKHFDISGASLSHHLNILKNAELISSRRDGQHIIYSLNLTVFEEILHEITKLFKK